MSWPAPQGPGRADLARPRGPDTGTTNGALPCRFSRNWASSHSRAVSMVRYMASRSSSVSPSDPWRVPDCCTSVATVRASFAFAVPRRASHRGSRRR